MRNFSQDWKCVGDITQEQIDFAQNFAQNTGLFKRQSGFNGSDVRRMVGCLGETIFCDIFGLKRPIAHNNGNDGGIDAFLGGKKIDIKSFNIKYPSRFSYGQNKFGTTFLDAEQFEQNSVLKTDVYVFCAVNVENKTAEFVGWIRKRDMKDDWYSPAGSLIPRGNTPFASRRNNYLIPFNHLNKFNPRTFESEMQMFAT